MFLEPASWFRVAFVRFPDAARSRIHIGAIREHFT
jgi:hypothetical protein